MYFSQVWTLLRGFRMNLPIIIWVAGATPGCTAISHETSMEPPAYFVRFRQVSSRATSRACSRVSSRRTFHEFFGQNHVNRGHNLGI